MCIVDSLILVYQMTEEQLPKRKAAAIVINTISVLPQIAWADYEFFFDLQWNEIYKWKMSKTFACEELFSV